LGASLDILRERPHVLILSVGDDGGKELLEMLIEVYVTPNTREARVVKVSEDYIEVWVDERAENGRANKRLLEILTEHFKVPKSRITILRGTKTRNKTIQVI
jgi:uncharacterized protein (TIGR00251 family)